MINEQLINDELQRLHDDLFSLDKEIRDFAIRQIKLIHDQLFVRRFFVPYGSGINIEEL